jgi:hypothetical protein
MVVRMSRTEVAAASFSGACPSPGGGPKPHLVGRFLARNVGDREARGGDAGRRLEEQGRLAMPGSPPIRVAERDEAAAQTPVEFLDPVLIRSGAPLRIEADQLDALPGAKTCRRKRSHTAPASSTRLFHSGDPSIGPASGC